jgi:PST family polysaccharide transporter
MTDTPKPKETRSVVALKGFAWLTLQSLGSRLTSILGQLALAWLLVPSDFGTIGLVYTLTTIMSSVANVGVDTVLLQRQRTLRLWMAPAFWTSLGLGALAMVATLAIAPFAGSLYHSPDFIYLAGIFSLAMPLTAASTVSVVILRSRLNFRFPALYNSTEFALVQAATVALAAAGLGAYSFVIPTPVAALVRFIVFYRVAPFRISLPSQWWQMRYLVSNGLTVLGSKLSVQAVAQGDLFLLGILSTKTQAGLYYFAFKLATQALWLIASSVSGVLIPMLTQAAGKIHAQVDAAWKVCRLIAYIVIPACMLQALLLPAFIRACFAARWEGSIPIAIALSVGIGPDAITWITGAFLNARKAYWKSLRLYVSFMPLFFLLVAIGAHYGAGFGAAVGVCAYYAVMAPVMTWLTFREHGIGFGRVAALFVRPILLGLAASALPAALLAAPWPRLFLLPVMGVQAAMWGVAYLALLAHFEPDILRDVATRFIPPRLRSALGARVPRWLGGASLLEAAQ